MKKTSAKVTYRDNVPWGWIAIKFCDVEFFGFRANELKRKWTKIEIEEFKKYDSIYEENKIKIQNYRDKAKSMLDSIDESKPFYRIWFNKKEKEMISESNILFMQAEELEKENKRIGEKRFIDYYSLKFFLKQNGFIITAVSSEGSECITKTEIWTLEE